MNNILCLAGPTASGKTALAVELAKEYNGEVVSCDAMYVYKGMDISTAKPSLEERQGIVHHMIDVAEPEEDFSVSRYCAEATPIVEDILVRGKTAIITGGTGLYMDSLIRGNDFAPFPATGVRERLEQEAAEVGFEAMMAKLAPSTRRRQTASTICAGASGRWKSTTKPGRPSPPTTPVHRPSRPDSNPCGWPWIFRTGPRYTAASTAGWIICWKWG